MAVQRSGWWNGICLCVTRQHSLQRCGTLRHSRHLISALPLHTQHLGVNGLPCISNKTCKYLVQTQAIAPGHSASVIRSFYENDLWCIHLAFLLFPVLWCYQDGHLLLLQYIEEPVSHLSEGLMVWTVLPTAYLLDLSLPFLNGMTSQPFLLLEWELGQYVRWSGHQILSVNAVWLPLQCLLQLQQQTQQHVVAPSNATRRMNTVEHEWTEQSVFVMMLVIFLILFKYSQW